MEYQKINVTIWGWLTITLVVGSFVYALVTQNTIVWGIFVGGFLEMFIVGVSSLLVGLNSDVSARRKQKSMSSDRGQRLDRVGES